ncbi:glycosyltransferase family 39 protein [Candidatus Parcubacteria bacterium]|nr:glycosyltransferase family 39 protein [Candidatus Parcubacteria bacterium]
MKFFSIKKIKKNWQLLTVIFLSLVFFIGTSSFNYYTQQFIDENGKKQEFVKWASPDETANYIFTKLYAQENKLSIEENYNLFTNDIMHPRSFRSDYGTLKPVSFLGIILVYGKIASIFGYKVIPYLTPFFASLGVIYFYLLVKRLFNKSNAWFSASLLAVFPPYIYFTARSMFHNVLFVVFLIISLYYCLLLARGRLKYLKSKSKSKIKLSKKIKFFFKNNEKNKKYYLDFLFAGLAGVFMGLAIIIRSSELLWLLPLLIFLWLFNIKKIGFSRLLVYLVFLLLAILPALHFNKALYSSYYLGGYSEMNQSIIAIVEASSDLVGSTVRGEFSLYGELLNKIKSVVFYFGLHPRQSMDMAVIYFVKMFSWLFWASCAGLLAFLINFRKYKKRHWLYIFSLLIISGILIIYYGSWEFYDNPDKTRHTIGNSYTRYWLPIYLGVMPFASLFVMRFSRAIVSLFNKFYQEKNKNSAGNLNLFSYKINKKFYYVGLRIVLLIIFFYGSLSFVLYGSEEGLIFLAQRQKGSRTECQQILRLTENNSAIITFYHDKLLFPERKVIVGLFDDKNMVAEYANLVELLPVYYYNFTLPEKDVDYLNNRRLAEAGLGIEKVRQITSDFTLYRLVKKVEKEDGS